MFQILGGETWPKYLSRRENSADNWVTAVTERQLFGPICANMPTINRICGGGTAESVDKLRQARVLIQIPLQNHNQKPHTEDPMQLAAKVWTKVLNYDRAVQILLNDLEIKWEAIIVGSDDITMD